MKVLAIAYSYNGQGKSESLVTYNLCEALRAMGHEITVLTRDNCFDDNVINFRPSAYLKQSSGIGKAHKSDYYPFIRKCFNFAKENLHNYDLLHHVSPISLRYHNPLADLDRPFIWGPVGGSIPFPRGFKSVQRREGALQRLRVLDRLRLRFDPLLRRTMNNSAYIVATSNAARDLIPEKYQSKTLVSPEGITPNDIVFSNQTSKRYIFSSGRLVPYKAFDLLIKAFAATPCSGETELWISGAGPDANYLSNLASETGKENRIKLLGNVDREKNLQLMRQSLFCVFPALNEAFGSVNLEAMAAGKTVVVTDWGGPSDLISDGIDGYKIPAQNERQYVEDLSCRIDHLLTHPGVLAELEAEALKTVKRYLWQEIAVTYDRLYKTCQATT